MVGGTVVGGWRWAVIGGWWLVGGWCVGGRCGGGLSLSPAHGSRRRPPAATVRSPLHRRADIARPGRAGHAVSVAAATRFAPTCCSKGTDGDEGHGGDEVDARLSRRALVRRGWVVVVVVAVGWVVGGGQHPRRRVHARRPTRFERRPSSVMEIKAYGRTAYSAAYVQLQRAGTCQLTAAAQKMARGSNGLFRVHA